MKRYLALLLAILMVLSLVACTQEQSPDPGTTNPGTTDPGTDEPGEKKFKLGLSFASLDALYFQAQKERAEQAAEELGFDLVVTVADNDSAKQLQQCENLLTQNVDALLCVPVDNAAIVSVVDSCKAKNVPYIAVEMCIRDRCNGYTMNAAPTVQNGSACPLTRFPAQAAQPE